MPEGGAFDSARWCEGDVDLGVASPNSKSSAPSSPPPAVGGGPRIAPFTGLALAASHEALKDANWDPSTATEPQLARCGVSVGAGMGHVSDLTNAGALLHAGKLRRVSPFFVPRILCNMAAGHISMAHGFRGINHAVSTACATGAHAIGDAFRAIQRGGEFLIISVRAIGLTGCFFYRCGFDRRRRHRVVPGRRLHRRVRARQGAGGPGSVP